MDHAEYLRLFPDADVAVLFVHGILGSPRHFDLFLPVIPPKWSVQCLLLDGHGKGVKDFSKSSMAVWRAQVSKAVEALSVHHKKLLIVGHSMGALLAVDQAVARPEAVKGIFLLAAPLRVFLRVRLLPNILRVWLNQPKKDDPVSQAFMEACSIRQDWRIWQYLGWIPRFWELLMECRRIRRLLPQLKVPCEAYQSHKDEMVGLRACKDLEPWAKVTVLERSNHFYYAPEDREQLISAFNRFCRKNSD